VLNLTRSVSTT